MQPLAQESLTAAPGRGRPAARAWVRGGGLTAAGSLAAAAILLAVFDRLSSTAHVTADSANAVLQGRAIAGGNVLLSGWTLSGASFYATDLPFYAAFSAIRGLTPEVAHDAGATIYTLLVLAACSLARGRARGPAALGRMAVTLVLLVAPAPGEAVQLLLLGPFHAGTTLVLLLALLVLDSAGERLWAGAVVWALLSLAVLSDALAVYAGVLPLALVSVVRLAAGRWRSPGARRDLAMLSAAVLSVPASLLAMGVIEQLGGFATVPLQASFAPVEELSKNFGLTLEGVLLLFGANFFGQPLASVGTLAILVRLAGLALVVVTSWSVLQTWRRGGELDRVTQVLVVAMALDLAAHLLSNQAIDVMTSRYLIPFMAFGAVLAGRVGADRLWAGRLRHAAAAVAVAYLAFGALSLRTPPAPTPETQLDAFLVGRHLTYGLAAYWQASTVTVHSGGRVQVRAVVVGAPQPSAYRWEAEGSWYDPSLAENDARFVLRDTWDSRSADRGSLEAAFGPPSHEYQIGRYEVLVWDRNLLDDLAR